MWVVNGQEQVVAIFEPFAPDVVLLWFDGPKTFTLQRDSGSVYLAHWCVGDDSTDRYLIVPIADGDLEEVQTGRISLRNLLVNASRHYIVDVNNDESVRNVWRIAKILDIPNEVLPSPDARLPFSATRL